MSQATVTTTAAQSGAVLSVPAPAAHETLNVTMVPGNGVQLPFNPEDATVSRSGNDLVFELDNGGTVTINNFFVTENGGELPTLILPQGEEVTAAQAFADTNLDLATAAGPGAAASASSGSGEYADNAGSLIGGVDRLGSLGASQWDRSTDAPEYRESALPAAVAAAGNGTDGAGTPDAPVGPSGPFDYVARGVMYPGAFPSRVSDRVQEDVELQVDLLSNGGKGQYPDGQRPDSVDLTFFGADGESITTPLQWSYDQASGRITFNGCPPDGVYYVLVTDSNGNSYYMQIVVDSNGDFNSKDQDEATPPYGGELAHGEWHSAKADPMDYEHDIVSSNLDDEMTFASGIYQGDIKTGWSDDRNWGNDTIKVEGNVQNTDIDFGDGTGKLTVNGSVYALLGENSTIKMAHGTIDITDTSDSVAYGAYGNFDSALKIEGGDSTVTIKAEGASGAYGVSANYGGLVDAKAGSITIDANASGADAAAYGVAAMDKSTVNLTADGKLDIDATAANMALGIMASGGSTVNVNAGSVDITATGGSKETFAVYANQGSVGITAANGDVTLTATGGKIGRGIFAEKQSSVDVTAENVTITTDGVANSIGMQAADSSKINVHSKGGAVEISASGADAYGMLAQTKGANLIDGAKTVTITSSNDGMTALTGGTNTITGNGAAGSEVTILSKGAGMYANSQDPGISGTSNTITGMETVHLGDASHRSFQGMNAYSGTNLIDGAKAVDIYAKSIGVTAGAFAGEAASNTINADKVTLDVASAGTGLGINASDNKDVSNTINAHDVTINVTGVTSSIGMSAGNSASNTINSSGGAVSITARGGESYGMYTSGADDSLNLIKGASTVNVTADLVGMWANRGQNVIKNITGETGKNAVEITANGVTGGVGNTRTGMNAANNKTNTVTTLSENRIENVVKGDVAVTASGAGGTNTAMNTYTITQPNGDGVARNIITGVKDGNVTLLAEKGNINYGMRAFAQSGSNTTENIIEKVSGKVSIKADGVSESHGMSVGGAKSTNSISQAGSVDITANAAKTAYGMHAENSGKNNVSDIKGDVSVAAGGQASTVAAAMHATGNGKNAIEDVRGNVHLTASSTGTNAYGMQAENGGVNSVHNVAKNVIIDPTGAFRPVGMLAEGGTNSITKVGGDVKITADGRWGYAMSATNGGKNIIGGDGDKGIAGAVEITAKAGADGPATAYGMHAQTGGGNTVAGAGSVQIISSTGATGGTSYAMFAESSSGIPSSTQNIIRDIAGSVLVKSSGVDSKDITHQVAAMIAHNGQNIIQNVGKGVTLEASGGNNVSSAMRVANNGENIIRGVKAGDDGMAVTAKSTSNNSTNAMEGYAGKNIIGGEKDSDKISGNVLIRGESKLTDAAGSQSARGMYAYGGTNTIQNVDGSVKVQAEVITQDPASRGSTSAYGMFSQQAHNTIKDVTGDVSVSAKGAAVNYGMFATGMRSAGVDMRGHNTIDNVQGTVNVTAEGGKEAIGMYAAKWGSGDSYPYGGTNTISNAGRVEINATTTAAGSSAFAMRAQDGGMNIIDNRLVVGDGPVGIIITAKGVAASYAMYANGSGSYNAIYGSETSANRIELRGDIYAAGGGKNILTTGKGDDHIMIDGKVSGTFEFNAGDGYDTLELRAASWTEFSSRYETWLKANFSTMSIENLQWLLTDSSGPVPAWLILLVQEYNAAHDTPLDVDYAALGLEDPRAASAPESAPENTHVNAHAGAADAPSDADTASTTHTSDAPSAADASQTGSNADDASDANASGPTADQNGVNPDHAPTQEDSLRADANGPAANDHADHAGNAAHDATVVDGDVSRDTITGGDDGNEITIHGDVDDSTIITGEGDDTVVVDGTAGDSFIGLSGGDDILSLNGFTGGSLDGGDGYDTLILNLDGQGGENAFGDDGAFSGLFADGAVKGFEEILLDMSGGNADTLFLADLMGGFKDISNGENLTIRITGDADDRVDTQSLLDGGWSHSDNGDGTSTWSNPDEAALTFIIQNGL